MKTLKKPIVLSLLACLLLSANLQAQPCNGKLDPEWIKKNYHKREVMIPMRDGACLSTAIYEPLKPVKGGSPVMMTRTPYGLKPYGPDEYASDLGTTYKNYVANGYIIVYQSVRGTYLSEGEYVNIRPVVSDNGCHVGSIAYDEDGNVVTDDASDSYDTIEWLLRNTENNGRVGIKGVSYPGYYSTIAAISCHPALRAASPQAPVTDWWIGDDFHHNGELMMADCASFGGSFLVSRKAPAADGGKTRVRGMLPGDGENLYDFYLSKGSISEIFKPFADSVVFWNDVLAHPDYDAYWEACEPTSHFTANMPAMLVVGGLFDAEDFYGPYKTYRDALAVKPDDVFFATGPWYHGAWRSFSYDHMDNAWFGTHSPEFFLDEIEYPFFAYYLEGKGEKPQPVWVLPSGESDPAIMDGVCTDSMWEHYDSWPAADAKGKKLYLRADGSVSAKHPWAWFKGRSYVSDPASPVPYFHKVFEQKKRDRDYMVGDQSFVENRSDVLTYKAEIQTDTTYFMGPVKVHLRLRQSTPDADYIVKLIDERPDGYQMLVRAEVMPARYRKGFTEACYAKPGKTFTLDYSMPDIAHRFLPGHRLVVQVQSSWFPLVAMNPQNAVDNYYKAVAEDYQCAEIKVLNGSYISIPVK